MEKIRYNNARDYYKNKYGETGQKQMVFNGGFQRFTEAIKVWQTNREDITVLSNGCVSKNFLLKSTKNVLKHGAEKTDIENR